MRLTTGGHTLLNLPRPYANGFHLETSLCIILGRRNRNQSRDFPCVSSFGFNLFTSNYYRDDPSQIALALRYSYQKTRELMNAFVLPTPFGPLKPDFAPQKLVKRRVWGCLDVGRRSSSHLIYGKPFTPYSLVFTFPI